MISYERGTPVPYLEFVARGDLRGGVARGLRFGVWEFGVQGLQFRVWGLGFEVEGLWFRVWRLRLRVCGAVPGRSARPTNAGRPIFITQSQVVAQLTLLVAISVLHRSYSVAEEPLHR